MAKTNAKEIEQLTKIINDSTLELNETKEILGKIEELIQKGNLALKNISHTAKVEGWSLEQKQNFELELKKKLQKLEQCKDKEMSNISSIEIVLDTAKNLKECIEISQKVRNKSNQFKKIKISKLSIALDIYSKKLLTFNLKLIDNMLMR